MTDKKDLKQRKSETVYTLHKDHSITRETYFYELENDEGKHPWYVMVRHVVHAKYVPCDSGDFTPEVVKDARTGMYVLSKNTKKKFRRVV
jgi:hypothetical protein